MNPRLLTIFRAVVTAQTTVGASRALGISQPAVSNGLGQLESELGFRLFDRVGNRLVPRPEAKTLFSASEAMFLYSQALDQTIEDLKENRVGHVRVSATPQLGHSMLPGAIQRFLADKPEVKVFYDVVDSYRVIESVETLAADFGLAIALEPELGDALTMTKLAAVEMVAVMPAGHPLADRDVVEPRDLKAFPVVGLASSARLSPPVVAAFREAAVPYRVSIEVPYSETACMLAAAGAGVAVVDAFSAIMQARYAQIAAVPFRPKIAVEAWVVHPKERPLSRLAQALLDEAKLSIEQFLGERADTAVKRNGRRTRRRERS